MNANDLILISVDDHLVEPPNMFDAHIPDRYRAVAPKIVRKPNGSDVWVFNGLVIVGVSDDDVAKISYENAMRWYSFDPFQHRAKETCTVGALRVESGDHDVAIRPFDKGRFVKQVGIDLGDLEAKATA